MSSGLHRLERFVDAHGPCVRRHWSRSPLAADLGVDPSREVAAQRLAAAAGIAPQVLEFDPQRCTMTMHWIEGAPLEPDWVLRPMRRAAVASLLERLRRLPPRGLPALDVTARCLALHRSLQSLSGERADDFARELQDVLQEARAVDLDSTHCLVHGDLSAANTVVRADGSLMLIDFEYAHAGSAQWDLAGLVTAVECDPVLGPAMRSFVNECLPILAEPRQMSQFSARVRLRSLLDRLWWAVVRLQTGNAVDA